MFLASSMLHVDKSNWLIAVHFYCHVFYHSYYGWLRNPAPVDRWFIQFIPLFIGFQHVSTILLVVYRMSQPSTVVHNQSLPSFITIWIPRVGRAQRLHPPPVIKRGWNPRAEWKFIARKIIYEWIFLLPCLITGGQCPIVSANSLATLW